MRGRLLREYAERLEGIHDAPFSVAAAGDPGTVRAAHVAERVHGHDGHHRQLAEREPADAQARLHGAPAAQELAHRGAAAGGLRAEAAERVSVAGIGVDGAALSGRWSLLAPSPENDTVRAVALVESILDRYGVLARDVALLSGVSGGLGALMPVLRSMEDAGDLLRGMFVKGLGPAQFAARETVDLLRTYAAEDDASDARSGDEGCAVLAADDPANLFGAGLPWPPLSGGDAPSAARPSRRPGSLVVVRDGMPVLYAAAGLRSVLAFTADEAALEEAARALVAHAARAVRRDGAEGSRKKVVVESFNGRPVLDTPFADVLQRAGLVRLPDGMRLYVDPFSRGAQ